jgi:LCP family protein required for cell wall assembly
MKQQFTEGRHPNLFANNPIEPEPPKRHKLRWLKRFLLAILLTALIIGLWLGWGFYRDAAKLTGNNNPLQVASMFFPTKLKTTNGRVNILVAGYSADDPGHAGADLTDSIMLLSIDPDGKSATVISIPRDLYVNIDGVGYSKINAAYEYGSDFNQPGYPAGGMGLLAKTIKQTLDVDVNYYGLINYEAFKSAVNAVGGVQVNIASTDPRGLYDPNTSVKLPNGPAALDGQTALNIARSRGDGYGSYGFALGDFERTKLQQDILLALKDKAGNTNIITNPFKVSSLVGAIGDNAKTDMNLREIQTLYRKSKAVNNSNIKTITLNNVDGVNLLANYRTKSGQSALIPAEGVDNFSVIQTTLNKLIYGTSQ